MAVDITTEFYTEWPASPPYEAGAGWHLYAGTQNNTLLHDGIPGPIAITLYISIYQLDGFYRGLSFEFQNDNYDVVASALYTDQPHLWEGYEILGPMFPEGPSVVDHIIIPEGQTLQRLNIRNDYTGMYISAITAGPPPGPPQFWTNFVGQSERPA